MRRAVAVLAVGMALTSSGCATLSRLGMIVQPPRIESAGRAAEFRFQGPSRDRRLGGASLRLWARVSNPNPFGLTLSALTGDLFLEGSRAAAVDFPLGLSLVAREETEVPLEISIGFDDLQGLGRGLSGVLGRSRLNYRIDGTVSVDAGPLGQPVFGPATLLQGDVDVRR